MHYWPICRLSLDSVLHVFESWLKLPGIFGESLVALSHKHEGSRNARRCIGKRGRKSWCGISCVISCWNYPFSGLSWYGTDAKRRCDDNSGFDRSTPFGENKARFFSSTVPWDGNSPSETIRSYRVVVHPPCKVRNNRRHSRGKSKGV